MVPITIINLKALETMERQNILVKSVANDMEPNGIYVSTKLSITPFGK